MICSLLDARGSIWDVQTSSQEVSWRHSGDTLEALGELQEAWGSIWEAMGCFLGAPRRQSSKFPSVYSGSWVLPGDPRDPPRAEATWKVEG